jgi:hypothetical protein
MFLFVFSACLFGVSCFSGLFFSFLFCFVGYGNDGGVGGGGGDVCHITYLKTLIPGVVAVRRGGEGG